MKKLVSIILILFFANSNFAQNTMDKKLKDFFSKDEVTILLTDSGLGGLSITSEVENLIRTNKSFKKAKIIFYNSQPEDTIGYNGMKSTERRVQVFNDALEGMLKFNPDIILIACNTLSVIYDKTPFANNPANPPVVGIVDFGVEMFYKKMMNNINSSIIIFGTPMTIAANAHKNKLIEKGIEEERIITSACNSLPGAIENDAHGEKARSIISSKIDSSAVKLRNKTDKVYLGLCCTHFGYSKDLFLDEASCFKKKEVLNPNSIMSNFVIKKDKRYNRNETTVEVYSRANLGKAEIASIGSLIKESSHKTERALQNYNLDKNLFFFEP